MANVNVEFTGNSARLNATIEQLKTSSQGAFAAMSQQAANFTIVAAGAAAAIRQFAGAWAAAANFEDATQRLAPMVGSLETARDLCEDLRLQAARGTQDFSTLASTAGRLASVFKNSSDIKKWTTAFHNLSAGTGLEMDRILQNFVKAEASGNFDASFLDTLAKRGVNVFGELSSQLGIAENEVKSFAKKGEISFEQVENALLSLTTGAGRFSGAAERMSSTANGSFRSMQASAEIMLAKLAEPVNEKVTPTLQKISDFLQKNADAATSAGNALAHIGRIVLPLAGIYAFQRAMFAAEAGVRGLARQMEAFGARCVATFNKASAGATGFAAKLRGVAAVAQSVAGAIAAIATAGGMIAGEAWISHLENQADAGEALAKMYERLNDAQNEFFAAQDADQLAAAYDKVEAAISNLMKRGSELHETLGTREGLNLEGMSNDFISEYYQRRNDFAYAQAEQMLVDRLAEQAKLKEEIAKKEAEIAEGNAKARKEVEAEISLLKAQLVSAERLAEVQEEIAQQEQITRSIKAGASEEEAKAIAEQITALRREVNEKQKAAAAGEALSEYEEELAILQAKADKNAELAKQLENERRIREETLRLSNAGVDAAIAEARARERVALEEKAANAERQKYTGTIDAKEVNRLLARGYSGEQAVNAAQAEADWRARNVASSNNVAAVAAEAPKALQGVTAGAGSGLPSPLQNQSNSLLSIAKSQLDALLEIRGYAETIASQNGNSYAILA